MTDLLRGAFDLHVHCSPDVVTRAQDAVDLAEAAHRAGMAGIGLKDHTTSTIGLCCTLSQRYSQGPRFFSSVDLNPPVGGLNPAAVEVALAAGVDIVYLSTYSAAHHIDVLGPEVTPVPHPSTGPERLRVADDQGALPSAVGRIVELVASHDAVLATGHVSPPEALAVLTFARECGVSRMVVTHASPAVPNMSVDDQQVAIQLSALIEHSFLTVTECCPGTIPLATIAEQIRSVGQEHVVLSSDFGQPDNGPPVEAFGRHADHLRELGFGDAALRATLCDNPGRLVENRKGRPR